MATGLLPVRPDYVKYNFRKKVCHFGGTGEVQGLSSNGVLLAALTKKQGVAMALQCSGPLQTGAILLSKALASNEVLRSKCGECKSIAASFPSLQEMSCIMLDEPTLSRSNKGDEHKGDSCKICATWGIAHRAAVVYGGSSVHGCESAACTR